MSRYYSSSLVPRDWHAPELVELMQSPLSIDMVAFVAAKTMDSIKCRPPPEAPPSPPTTPGTEMKDEYSPDCLPPLDYFIQSILTKSRCHVPTLLCTLVYLERLKKRLPTHARGCHTTRHRVFLAVLIVAAKYLNDSSPQNKHWQRYAAFFQLSEITLMERQLLTILNFDLNFTEDELMACLRPLLHPEETLAVEEPVAGPSTAPIEEHRSLAAEISASAIDADLVERGASAKRKRLDARAGMSPVQRRPSLPEEATTTVQPLSVKRLTPEYVVKPEATAQEYPSSASSSRRSSASVEEVQQPGLPSAPAPALRRPQLRSFLLRGSTSSISQAPRPARVESWASSDVSNSPSTFRSSIMSCSSTSTVSSASTGPRTPPTPMEDHVVKKLPLSMANLALASSSCAPDAQAREVLVVEEDDVSVAPTPSLIQALAHQPDLWPLMYSSGVSSRQARSMSSTAQKQRARLIESGDASRRGSSLISV